MKYSLRSLRIRWRYLGVFLGLLVHFFRTSEYWIGSDGVVDVLACALLGLIIGWAFEKVAAQ